MTEFQIGIQAAYDLKPNPRQVWPKNHLNHAACKLLLFCCSPSPAFPPTPLLLLLPAPSAILSAICCVVFCGFIGCAFAHSICKMIGIYAYRLDAVTLPPPRGYPFHPLLPTSSRFSPAVTALPADFRPLSLAAGHCGYCPLSLPPSQCPGRCTCIFTCTAATTLPHLPLSPGLLPDSCFASVIVSCPWTFALCGVCWHVSSLCSLLSVLFHPVYHTPHTPPPTTVLLPCSLVSFSAPSLCLCFRLSNLAFLIRHSVSFCVTSNRFEPGQLQLQ